ncbi:glycoside hydrolase family 16 protein [Dactylosporangium sp. CA-233914]|uniref:glycoside hydrolase family 16 protein n=1 Tax=Dactylosporangium sp. CA-233914 TaxID=3239934 RepID=UPI003D9142EE
MVSLSPWTRRAGIAALVVAVLAGLAALAMPRGGEPALGRTLTRTSSTQITAGVGWTHRWTAAPDGVTDAAGNRWDPDGAVVRGGDAPRAVGAGSPEPYRFARAGTPAFTLPVPQPGTYAVTLSLAAPERGAAPEAGLTVALDNGSAPSVRLAATGNGRVRHAVVLVPVTGDAARLSVTASSHLAGVAAVTVTMARTATDSLRAALAEEFDGPAGTALQPGWRHETGGGGWGNGELQEYTQDSRNGALTGDGRLAITARADGGKYTSARIRTGFEGLYGRIEGVLQVPSGRGLLPAFWMLGADVATAGWPQAGEVDLMESLGAAEPGLVHGTFHGPDGSPRGWERPFTARPAGGPDTGMHRYALEWWPGVLQWSVDGVVQATLRREDLGARQQWVFERPAFLLLNVAVGGRWPGTPPSATVFPQTMYVESVHWWR